MPFSSSTHRNFDALVPSPGRQAPLKAVAVPQRAAGQAAQVTCRVLDPRHLEALDLQAWSVLEQRALEPNINLSAHFVLPALQHLDPHLDVRLHVAERTGDNGSRQLIGLALLHSHGPLRLLGLPHLSAYHCRHAFLGHWLLDQDHAEAAAVALLRQLRRRNLWASALTLPNCPIEGPLLPVLKAAAAQLGLGVEVVGVRERAVLVPAQAGAEALRRQLRKQFNDVERCRRRLQEQGSLDWRVLRGDVPEASIEAFLALEHSGWKQASGTSLRSKPGDEAFFRAMTRGFASEGRAMFTEVRLNGRVIASTCNYVCNDMGFAFKVGWDEAFRKHRIGIFNEAEFVRHAPEVCGDLSCIDSGAQPASFIELALAGPPPGGHAGDSAGQGGPCPVAPAGRPATTGRTVAGAPGGCLSSRLT